MCGVAGYWNLDSKSLPSLCDSLNSRGPDGFGEFNDLNIRMFHTRLSIQDLTTNASQPMSSQNVTIAFNGEVYNFRHLRILLEDLGYFFVSKSDTEVILNLYIEFGTDCFAMLRGMFAIAIYDNRSQKPEPELILARDEFGIKPLLFSRKDQGLIFASDLRTILASGLVSKEIDNFSLRELFAVGSIYQPRTILKDVSSISAGRYAVIGIDSFQEFDFRLRKPSNGAEIPRFEKDVVGLADTVINDSLSAHLIADVEVSTLLSGGLDSSLISAMIAKNHVPSINTFTVGFDNSNKADESADAREIAGFLGTSHHEIMLSEDRIEADFLDFVCGIDQPSMDGFNSFLVSKVVSQHTKVTISGTGGDELFAGYPWFQVAHGHGPKCEFQKLSRFVRENSKIGTMLPPFFNRLAFRSSSGIFTKQNQAFGYPEATRIVKDFKESPQIFINSFLDYESRESTENLFQVSNLSLICCAGYLKNQLLRDIDATSMYHSLEVRTPLLDREVLNFAISLPDKWKLGHGSELGSPESYSNSGQKYILGKLSELYLPPQFLNRKKRGFELPIESWLKGPLKKLLETKLSKSNLSQIHNLDVERTFALKEKFLSGSLAPIKIWLVLVYVVWYELLMESSS
jgi:asparagine synthase (glutamine-hydrolysing)